MTETIQLGELTIEPVIYNLVNTQVIPGTGVDAKLFWSGFESIIRKLMPKTQALLEKRGVLQKQITQWYKDNPERPIDLPAYKAFLKEIGYLVDQGGEFKVTTSNVDPEIATIAGPQLVVPVMNARYALNAANARWGSLYDALYGTDVIPETDGAEKGKGYNPLRGAKVVAYAANFLDQACPLAKGSHKDVVLYDLENKEGHSRLKIKLSDGSETQLANPEHFVGYKKSENLDGILLKNNQLHLEIQLDPTSLSEKTIQLVLKTSCQSLRSQRFKTVKIQWQRWMLMIKLWFMQTGWV